MITETLSKDMSHSIAIVGDLGSAKSTFLNEVMQKKVFLEGDTAQTCTTEFTSCVFELNGQKTLWDSPGLNDPLVVSDQ